MVGIGVSVGVGVAVGGSAGSGVGDGSGVDDGVTVGTSVACATVFHKGMTLSPRRVSPAVVVHANANKIANDNEIAATIDHFNLSTLVIA